MHQSTYVRDLGLEQGGKLTYQTGGTAVRCSDQFNQYLAGMLAVPDHEKAPKTSMVVGIVRGKF